MILVFLFLLTSVSLSAMEITRQMTITSEHAKKQLIFIPVEKYTLTGYFDCQNYFLVSENETVCCNKNENSSHHTISITYTDPPSGYNKTLHKDEHGNVHISATKKVERLYQKPCSPSETDEENKEQDYEKYLNFFRIIQTRREKLDQERKKGLLLSQNYAKKRV